MEHQCQGVCLTAAAQHLTFSAFYDNSRGDSFSSMTVLSVHILYLTKMSFPLKVLKNLNFACCMRKREEELAVSLFPC